MKQRMMLVVGSLLLLIGGVTGLYLSIAITNAQLLGNFAAIVTDAPSTPFSTLDCPLLLGRYETSQVLVSITNPTQNRLEYVVTFAAVGLTKDAPVQIQATVIAGHQTTALVWKVTAVEAGNQTIFVQALSNLDRTLPGLFHTWPTSFQQGCGVFVMDMPLTGAQVMWLSGFSAIAGIVVIFAWLARRQHRRNTTKKADVV